MHFCRRVQWTRPFAWGVPPQVELTPSALEALALGAPTAPEEEMGSYDSDGSSLASWEMFRSELPNEEATLPVPLPPSYTRSRSAPPLVGRRFFGPRGI